jgi:hypothetical protein
MHSTIGGSLLAEEYHLYVLETIGARPSGAIRWTETWAHTPGPLIPLDAARCPLPAAARPGRPVAEARPTRPRRPGEGMVPRAITSELHTTVTPRTGDVTA